MSQVQETLADRYELLDVLGRGGMGVVYRARDRRLDRIVAIKVLPVDSAQDPTSVARFEREALAAAGLTHRNIVAVFDSGLDDGTRFIVMERVRGKSLAQLILQRGPLDIEEAVDMCAQVASALAAAHAAGIVHRDIKPANLMLDEHGTVKVLDFGIVRLAGGVSLTQAATVLGSAAYLAPEVSRGSRADARSDIYALGCVLYELLTGRPPFTGEQPAAILSQHITSSPARPEQLNPAIPPRLADLILAMLAKDPEHRPQRAGEVAVALPETLSGPSAEEAVTSATVAMPRFPATAWLGRRFGIAAAATVIALAIAGLDLSGGSGAGTGQSAARAATNRRSATQSSRRRSPATKTTASVSTPVSAPTVAAAPAKHHEPVPHHHNPVPHHDPGPHHGPGPGDKPGRDGGPSGDHPAGPHGSPPAPGPKSGDGPQNQK